MDILFATTNPAKIKKYKDKLQEKGINLLTIKDIGIELDIDENGSDSLENAYIKANAYYNATKIPTIGMDNSLFLEGVPKEEQPGTHVRRVGGKVLNDEEMLTHYIGLVKKYGGKIDAKWVYGMVYIDERGKKEFTWSKGNFTFVDTPCKTINQGYPLDSINIVGEYNKYLAELTADEKVEFNSKDSTLDVIEFIVNSTK